MPTAHYVNIFLNDGYFPDILKYSRVTPIFKRLNSLEPNGYRPIPNMSIITSKIILSTLKPPLNNYCTLIETIWLLYR